MRPPPKNRDWVCVVREVARDIALGERVTLLRLVRYVGHSDGSAPNVLAWMRMAAAEIGATITVGTHEEKGLVRIDGLDEEDIGLEQPEREVTEKTKRRRRIRELGLCTDCKDPAEAQGFCGKHLAMHRARNRRRKAKLEAMGLCRECSAPVVGRKTCRECVVKQRPAIKSLYRAKRRAGLCICRKPARSGRATCAQCAERQGEAERLRAAERLGRGKCTRCGKHRNDGETEKCKRCREECRIASTKSYHKKHPPKRRRSA